MEGKQLRLVSGLVVGTLVLEAMGVLFLLLNSTGDNKSSYSVSAKEIMYATRPYPVFQTHVSRFGPDYSLDLSVGFIFDASNKEEFDFMFTNFRLILRHLNQPINVFVCHEDRLNLSKDQIWLLNFVLRVQLQIDKREENTIANCRDKFKAQYHQKQPQHVVVFGPEVRLTEKSVSDILKIIEQKEREDEFSPIVLASNYNPVMWITSGAVALLGLTVLCSLSVLFRRVKQEVLLGESFSRSSWGSEKRNKTKTGSLYFICDRNVQSVLLLLYSIATIVLLQTQIQTYIERYVMRGGVNLNWLVNFNLESVAVLFSREDSGSHHSLDSLFHSARLISMQ